MVLIDKIFTTCQQHHKGLCALVMLFLVVGSTTASAGGGWVYEPGKGSIRIGYDWKYQPDALRRDTKGELYRSLFDMTHDFRFLYFGGDIGIVKGLEGSLLVTYLWAAETVDSTSEDPSHFYHGLSDMWVGLKYQLLSGEFPVAVEGIVRLPYLYEAASTHNGQPLTEIPGLLKRDYELKGHVSHSFSNHLYSSLMSGFRIREGAPTNQILTSLEMGGTLPIAEDRIFGKVSLNGVFSVGEPRPSNSTDRFSGLSLERDNHLFDFNDASYLQPQVGIGFRPVSNVMVNAEYGHIVWGHSTVVYRDLLLQVGYSF